MIVLALLGGCERSESNALRAEDNRLSTKIDVIEDRITAEAQEATENLNLQMEQAEQEIAELQERLEDQAARVALLQLENQALKSTDSRLLRSLAFQGSNTDELKATIEDVFRILKQQEIANNEQLREIEARRQRAEAAAAPIKERIHELATRRDACSARLAELTGPVKQRPIKGISQFALARAAQSITAERDRLAAPEVKMLKETIFAIDRDLQAATAQLSALRE